MEKHIAISIPQNVIKLSKLFNEAGFDLFLIGGSVRDLILGKEPKDWDVCTNAVPNSVVTILQNAGIEYNLQGSHFGIVVARFDNEDIEVATFRSDDWSQLQGNNPRHNKVKVGVTMKEDSERRDFTINALYFDINKKEIIDFHHGIDDLKNKLLRCVGIAPERFSE